MSGERGFAMIWMMLVVVMVAAASSVLFTRSDTLAANTTTDRMRQRSFWAAEGGLAHARHALAADPEFTGDTTQIGNYRAISTVTRADSGWKVEIRATPGGARLTVALKPAEGLPLIEDWRSE